MIQKIRFNYIYIILVFIFFACQQKNNMNLINDAVKEYIKQENNNQNYESVVIDRIDTINRIGYANIMLNLIQEEIQITSDSNIVNDMQADKDYWIKVLETTNAKDTPSLFYLVYATINKTDGKECIVVPLTLDYKLKEISLTERL